MKYLAIWIGLQVVAGIAWGLWLIHKDSQQERKLKVIANLPRSELLQVALADDPSLESNFVSYSRIMGISRATEFVTDNWLINRGILYLRDEES